MNKQIQTEADELGFFGEYGGQYVPETLMPAIIELKKAYKEAKADPEFQRELEYYLSEYVGRATPLTYAASYTESLGGAKIYLKREDLNHTGAHKINNALGQALLAKRMGKKKLVAETGAGQHGVASATVAALFDMELVVFMGSEDIKRQQLNVFRMELLGAKVVAVEDGQGTLSDAIVACIGGGSNAIGTFYPFIKDDVALYGVEAAGQGEDTDKHALAIGKGSPGVLHGTKMYLIQDEGGQVQLAHSISAGLDYPGIGPEHSYYHDIGRVTFENASDTQAMNALINFTKHEGIIPAIESAHALSYVERLAPTMSKEDIIVVTISGRGDKDMETIRQYMAERGLAND
ncbi:TPA: tryptophan synthase subunit beta [Staphylococcus aureus]|nr:tryptophan synthase subunit beta [Staphylococcus aureus]HDA5609669.1 tryptophan synthase subunit beta [Staphylococcus aureus]